MMARFVGGAWDGKVRETKGAARIIVPVFPQTGHVDDVRLIDVQAIHERRPPKCEIQIYNRRKLVHDDGGSEYIYEIES